MQTNSLRWVFPFVALVVGVVGFMGINAIAQEPEKKEVIDTRPTVQVEPVTANDHQVIINSYGEVKPLENTQLSVQVSGEALSWHPNFVAKQRSTNELKAYCLRLRFRHGGDSESNWGKFL